MTSSIIEHLAKLRTGMLAYYYFSFQNRESQNLRNLTCALLVQVLKSLSLPHPTNPDVFFIPGAFRNMYDAHFPSRSPSMEELESTLVDIVGLSETTYIVIDALDECDSQMVWSDILTFLSNLINKVGTNLYILVTSRQEVDIETKIAQLPVATTSVALRAREVDRDIINHLHAVLKEDSFTTWSDALKKKVTDHLVQHADGVFRWADLQLQGLRGKSREVDVNRALKRLPRDLGETYSRMLQRIDEDNYRLEAMAVLRWLACASRPLSLAELAELAVFDVEDSDQANLPPSSGEYRVFVLRENRFNSASEVLHILSGLVITTRSDGSGDAGAESQDAHRTILSFSHFSVKEYLQSTHVMPPMFRLVLNECHWFVLKCCFAYMFAYDMEKNAPSEKYDLLLYACFSTWYHVKELNILNAEDVHAATFHSVTAPSLERPGYATAVASEKIFHECKPRNFNLVIDFLEKFNMMEWQPDCLTTFMCFHEDMGPRDAQSVEHLLEATVVGNVRHARLLLDGNVSAPADILTTFLKGRSGMRIHFRRANMGGPVADLSLTVGSAVDAVKATETETHNRPRIPRSGRTSIEGGMAMWNLLQSQPGVNLNAQDREGRTPLLMAAMRGDEELFDHLFTQDGVDIGAKECHGWDLLTCALLGRNTNIIKTILDSGRFELDHEDLYGRTTLEWSVHLGLYMLLASATHVSQVSGQSFKVRQMPFNPIKEVWARKRVWYCAFSRGGSRVALCLSSDEVRVYDLEEDQFQSTLRHEGAVTHAAWSPDDSMILTLGLAGATRLWNSHTGELIKDFSLQHVGGYRCHWLPDGASVIITSRSETMGIVSMTISDGHYHSWLAEEQHLRVHCSALSKDAKWLVALASLSWRLLIYEVEHEKLTASIPTRERPTWVSISDNLSLIVVGYMDGGFETRLLPSGEVVWSRPGISKSDFLLQGSAGGADDAFLLRPEENGYISAWDLRSGTFVGLDIGHHPSRTNAATWNPANPSMFASGGDDGWCRM
ncbi:hypothetical protein HDV57DRAFT_511399 [Trichoderma longibrachiatum]